MYSSCFVDCISMEEYLYIISSNTVSLHLYFGFQKQEKCFHQVVPSPGDWIICVMILLEAKGGGNSYALGVLSQIGLEMFLLQILPSFFRIHFQNGIGSLHGVVILLSIVEMT